MSNLLQRLVYSLQLKLERMDRKLNPTQIVVLSFLFVIFSGTVLLSLPVSIAEGAPDPSVIDTLFVAVSATCVTGLTPVVTAEQWSVFGQLVILLMIQIGGLSLFTLFTYFAVNTGRKINMRYRMTIQATMNQNNMQGMVRIVLLAVKLTFTFEFIGMVLLFFFFYGQETYSLGTAAYFAFFHSISAFCNAGFDIIGEVSFTPFVGAPLLNLTIMSLIVSGGIGFVVWRDIIRQVKYHLGKLGKRKPRLSVHTKLALLSTGALIVLGAAYFFVSEYGNPGVLGKLSLGEKFLASFFQSVTLRTAGFVSIDQGALTEASKFVSSLLMFIGGSPGGTAGGIKTLTLALIVLNIWATFRGNDEIVVFGRGIPSRALKKAITVFGIMTLLWFAVSIILDVTESGNAFSHDFMDLMFETASALGTVGVTTGITPHLSPTGKVLIMLCMFVGRLGPISIATALQTRLHSSENSVRYAEEDVLIG